MLEDVKELLIIWHPCTMPLGHPPPPNYHNHIEVIELVPNLINNLYKFLQKYLIDCPIIIQMSLFLLLWLEFQIHELTEMVRP